MEAKNGEVKSEPSSPVSSQNVRCSNSKRSRSRQSVRSTSSINSAITPPDGGWGWVIVAASFMAHFIADGCAFSFGIFFEEFLDVFQESKGETAIVGSLFLSVPLITGPIASALTNRYGCRPVCMMGGFIAGVGLICSAFVNSIEMLCFTFGIVSGFGLSMVYVPAIVIVAFYFESKRAFATGELLRQIEVVVFF